MRHIISTRRRSTTCCVRPGVFETAAALRTPASVLSIDDLPTFERPMNATSGRPSDGSGEPLTSSRIHITPI
jgi:hypothetical protein